jgi:ribonuclease HII
MPDFSLERELARQIGSIQAAVRIAGLDEVGRGPWAGPVVAAAVWLEPKALNPALSKRLDDSKKLSKTAREDISEQLWALESNGKAAIALGQAGVGEIDSLNILKASLLAMTRAMSALPFTPDGALVDGNRLPDLPCPAVAVIKGDGRSLSIAAASIIAKVSRDRQMAELALKYPGYGWERNQGYGTAEHRDGIARLGITGAHRLSFRPIREAALLTL